MNARARAIVQRFLDEHHDVGVRVAVEPFEVMIENQPRKVSALELRTARDLTIYVEPEVVHVFTVTIDGDQALVGGR